MPEIGSTLREARMRARIDISEVEARTKIRAKYLRAIENEEWDLLPGTVFVKSFLKTYGDYLGLDSRMLLDEFRRRYERPSDHELRPVAALGRERERERAGRSPGGPRVPPWLAVLVVLVGVGVALYIVGESSNSNHQTPPANIGTGTQRHSGGHTSTTTSPTTTQTTKKVTKPAAPRLASLTITPTSVVWICVEKVVHGVAKPAFPSGDYSPGQTVPSARGAELLVTLGNAGATTVIDGKPYPLSQTNTAIGLKITPTGVRALAPGTQPTCGV